MAAHEDLANCKLRTLPAFQGGGLGFIAIEDIWHGQEILMANREYSNPLAEDSRELLSPPTVDSHGGDMQEEPELRVTLESDNTEVDLTIPSSQQYATLTDTGGWKMHEPSPPWRDGLLQQQGTSPPPVNNLPRWQALTSEYNQREIPIAESPTLRKDLWLTTLNCGSLSEANSATQINKTKLSTICWQFQRCGSDVMYLTDTRLTHAQGRRAIDFMRSLLPAGTFIRQSAVEPHAKPTKAPHKRHWTKRTEAPSPIQLTSQHPSQHGRIGGMLLIVSNKWSKHIRDWWKDPSGLGVVSSVTIQAMSQDITIFGTYWPFLREGMHSSESAGSLWNQLLEQYLRPIGSSDNPREYVEGQVSQQMVRRLGKEHNTCAIIGDFNGRLSTKDPGAGPVILDLMCSKGWIPFLHTALTETQLHPVRTYWRGGGTRTCPDHAFVHSTSEQLLTPSGAYVLDGLSELSDGHHILGVAFQVVDGPLPASMAVPKQHHTHRRHPPARPKSQKDLDRYQALLLNGFGRNRLWTMRILVGMKQKQRCKNSCKPP